MPKTYYNEFDKNAAAWLRELIKLGLIADGDVDERSICDVHPNDLVGYRQHHFFAGIGGWSLACRLAGIPDDFPITTGSCPCQPFSNAGNRKGTSDERHLWPQFARIIGGLKPAICAGEQVASRDGREWLAGVRTDLEGMGHEVGAADLCASGEGSPHIRQRLFWLAYSKQRTTKRHGSELDATSPGVQESSQQWKRVRNDAGDGGNVGGMEHTIQPGLQALNQLAVRHGEERKSAEGCCYGGMGNAINTRPQGHGRSVEQHDPKGRQGTQRYDTPPGFWSHSTSIPCGDGKTRRIEPGTPPLVNGVPRGMVPSSYSGVAINAQETAEARVMRLKGYGNAIVPQAAATFLRCAIESILELETLNE